MRRDLLKRIVAVSISAMMIPLQVFMSEVNVSAAEIKKDDTTQWELVWSDEFDGNSLDENKWTYRIGTTYNGEQQYYKKENVSVSDGTLKITAKSEETSGYPYTSGRISTGRSGDALFATKYGRIEAKIKLPEGTGLWPAFWMMPKDNVYGNWPLSGEIDIMEARGRLVGEVNGGIHFGQSGSDKRSLSDTYTFTDGSDITDYHVYAVEWKENEIIWFVDGVEFYRASNWYTMSDDGVVAEYPAPFDQEFYIILNLAVGGEYDGYKNPSNSDLPATMEVDYVRVYHDVNGYSDENITMPEGARDDEAMAATPVFEDGNLLSDINFEKINNNIMYKNQIDITTHNWYFLTNKYYLGDATLSKDILGNRTFLNIDVIDPGTQAYSIMLAQQLPLANGYVYKVSFDAKCPDGNKLIKAKAYGKDMYSCSYKANLTTELQHFEFTFLMEHETDMEAHLEINVGQYEGDVYIGNVSVKVVDTYVTSDNKQTDKDVIVEDVEIEETIERETELETEEIIESEPQSKTEETAERESESKTEEIVESEPQLGTEKTTEIEAELETGEATASEAELETGQATETETELETEEVTESETELETKEVNENRSETKTNNILGLNSLWGLGLIWMLIRK